MLVVGAASCQVREEVEGKLAVFLRVSDGCELILGLSGLTVLHLVLEGPKLSSLSGCYYSAVKETSPQPLVEAAFEIPRLLELLCDPRVSHVGFILRKLLLLKLLPIERVLVNALSSEHASLDSIVRAFDFGYIQEASGVTG